MFKNILKCLIFTFSINLSINTNIPITGSESLKCNKSKQTIELNSCEKIENMLSKVDCIQLFNQPSYYKFTSNNQYKEILTNDGLLCSSLKSSNSKSFLNGSLLLHL